jgi:hypothetical protein
VTLATQGCGADPGRRAVHESPDHGVARGAGDRDARAKKKKKKKKKKPKNK